MKNAFYYCLSVAIFLISCKDEIGEVNNVQENGDTQLLVDKNKLNERLTHSGRSIEINLENIGGRVESYTLILKSEVLPPEIDNRRVMASSIAIVDDFLAVGYNYAGNQFYGGVDLIDKAGDNLQLISSLSHSQSDISMVHLNDEALHYAGGSSESDSIAFAITVPVHNGVPEMEQFHKKRLGGHMATCIAENNTYFFVTSGADTAHGGGLQVLEKNSLKVVKNVPIQDARWVEIHNEYALVLSGNPGTISFVKLENWEIFGTLSVSGLSSPGHKSTFDVFGDYVVVASGYEGINIYQLSNGTLVENIPLPVESSDLIANSVSIDGNLGFVAAGELVFLIELEEIEGNVQGVLVGSLELGEYQSINEVKYSNGFLAIAAGLGGTKLIEVSGVDSNEFLYENTFSSDNEINQWRLVEDNGTGNWTASELNTGILTMDDNLGSYAVRLFNETEGQGGLLFPLYHDNGLLEFEIASITGDGQYVFVQAEEFSEAGTYLGQIDILEPVDEAGFYTVDLSSISWNQQATQVRFIIAGANYHHVQGVVEIDLFRYTVSAN